MGRGAFFSEKKGEWVAGNLKFVRVFLGIKSKHVEMMED